jgi:hypothetical protein
MQPSGINRRRKNSLKLMSVDITLFQCKSNPAHVDFYQHSRIVLHLGERHPILVDSHGPAGRLEPIFPGFGLFSDENRSRKVRPEPMLLVGVLSKCSSLSTSLAG